MNRVETNNLPSHMDFGFPSSDITAESLLLPIFNNNPSLLLDCWVPKLEPDHHHHQVLETTTIKPSDSGITYNHNNQSRKRCRDTRDSFQTSPFINNKRSSSTSTTFLGEDISLYLQQQELETDLIVSQHMERVKMMMLERKKQQSRRLVAAIEARIINKLREKEEQINKVIKLNMFLEEKVKILCLENQMWRNLAETNEATANMLRCNLEQVLLSHQQNQIIKEEEDQTGNGDAAEDAESCCGSSGEEEEDGRRCRKCGKEEAKVVVLPCRHLCVCSVCVPTLNKCPICDTNKTGTVHVIIS